MKQTNNVVNIHRRKGNGNMFQVIHNGHSVCIIEMTILQGQRSFNVYLKPCLNLYSRLYK